MTNKPEHIETVCSQNTHLKSLFLRARQLNQLNIILQQALPIQFVNHCHLANISEKSIIIHTDNANFASLIRFQAASLCKALSQHLPHPVSKLEVKVKPTFLPLTSDTSTNISLSSDAAANALNRTAQSMEEGTLKTAMENLAKRYQTD
ncbi:MAG: hypothetical protein COB23_01910 [Methylophaga sp.]|nr:MAG: hypothetical protein COB23_01910 [Methylophaga sp.]